MPSQLCVQSMCAQALASRRKPRWQPASVHPPQKEPCLETGCFSLRPSRQLHKARLYRCLAPRTQLTSVQEISSSEHLQTSAGKIEKAPV